MDPFARVTALKPAQKAFSLAEEFKNFAFKGNVIDMAVGVVIGTAFAKIVESLVKNLMMPLVSLLLPGNEGYLDWKLVVHQKEVPFGLFIGDVINFLIIALVLFLFAVKFLGWIVRTKKEAAAVAPPLTKDQELLIEIRDLLKASAGAPPGPPAPGLTTGSA